MWVDSFMICFVECYFFYGWIYKGEGDYGYVFLRII